jgi:transcriptional regulator with XRE-family HTH domain
MSWGERMKHLRKELGFTVRDFARLYGKTEGTISNYENGLTKVDSDVIDLWTKINHNCALYLIGLNPKPFDSYTFFTDTKFLIRERINKT